MFYEKRHVAYKPTKGGTSIPSDKVINDLKKAAVDYIGTYSEYNPIGYTTTGFGTHMTAVVVKEMSVIPKTDFSLPGYKLKTTGGYHSSDFNNNGGMAFSREDLLRIANAMDSTDVLQIAAPDSLNVVKFIKDIKTVTLNGN